MKALSLRVSVHKSLVVKQLERLSISFTGVLQGSIRRCMKFNSGHDSVPALPPSAPERSMPNSSALNRSLRVQVCLDLALDREAYLARISLEPGFTPVQGPPGKHLPDVRLASRCRMDLGARRRTKQAS